MSGTHVAPEPAVGHDQAARHDPIYDHLAGTEEFRTLRHRYRRMAFPATLAFIAWYALYVLMSMWATDFMTTKVVGHINIALIFGLLQFVTTFTIAWLYERHSSRVLDPLAAQLTDMYHDDEVRLQTGSRLGRSKES